MPHYAYIIQSDSDSSFYAGSSRHVPFGLKLATVILTESNSDKPKARSIYKRPPLLSQLGNPPRKENPASVDRVFVAAVY
ncbi:MAG: hypothetical protein HW389_2631 [Bacteroidetes bacterium]|nr:hypothetical protein [Bacteroidota bacterium]